MFKIKGFYQTSGVFDVAVENLKFHADVITASHRFMRQDWGDVCEEDKLLNDASLQDGSRIIGAYQADGEKIWVIADAEDEEGWRIVTVLFPDEY